MRKTSRVGAAIVGALAAALSAGAFTYTPASVSTPGPSVPTRSHLSSSLLQRSTVTNSVQAATAPDVAGYLAISGTMTFRLASAHFTVPYLDCRGVTVPQAAAQHWVGLGFTEEVGVETDCNGTTPAYRAFWAFWPQFHYPSITIHPGNSILMSVYFNSTTREYKFTFTDSSNGQGFTRTASCPSSVSCARHDADAISETPADPAKSTSTTVAFLPLADFQASSFDNVKVTNTSGTHKGGLQSRYWNTLRVNMVSGSSANFLNFDLTGVAIAPGLTLANTTPLYNKNTFLVYWNPNNAG